MRGKFDKFRNEVWIWESQGGRKCPTEVTEVEDSDETSLVPWMLKMEVGGVKHQSFDEELHINEAWQQWYH